MPTPQELVPDAMKFFFEQVLPQATGKTFAQLSSPAVHLGSYVHYDGGPVTTSVGQSLTPKYCLRVSPALPVQGDLPSAAGASVAAGGPLTHLLWVRNVADAAVDDVAEIQRVMADLDSFSQLFGPAAQDATNQPVASGGGNGAAPPAASSAASSAASLRAADWSQAIAANRAALPGNLSALTDVPAPFRPLVDDVAALQQVLRHFFTYRADGTHYARWSGAGRDPSNGGHLTPEYKQENVREVVLDRDRIYLYAVVPEGLLAGTGDLGQGIFREIVIRLDETLDPERPYSVATVHTARWRRGTAPHEDLVFFYAEEGAGPPIPRAAKLKMAGRLVDFLDGLAAAGDQRNAFLDRSNFVVKDEAGYFAQLVARVEEGTALPEYTVSDSTQFDRAVLVPPDRIVDLALVPAVQHLAPVSGARFNLARAKQLIHHADLVAKIAAGKRGGKGVVVGIIDSGIDGSHPAFAGRIHSFWDQGNPALVAGNTPKANNPGKDEYKLFNFGVELTGADTSKAQDGGGVGHGTHVAGIAAGAEVKDASGTVLEDSGLAPEATIVAVRAIGVSAPDQQGLESWLFGASYIFQKAKELGMPCVINMSFGSHGNAHDASDASSRDLFGRLTDAQGKYVAGRVVVAAAGNERDDSAHVRRTVPARSGYFTLATIDIPANVLTVALDIWVRNPTNTCPVAFPLDLYMYRVATPAVAEATKAVRIGQSANPAGVFLPRRTVIGIFSHASDVINGDHEYVAVFQTTDMVTPQPMVASRWAVAMINGDSKPLDVHMWITFTNPGPPASGEATFVAATGKDDVAFLVGSPAASPAAISVASVNSTISWTALAGGISLTSPPTPPVGELSIFSSPGPLRDASIARGQFYKNKVTHEINAVDVTAPGCMIQSALSSQAPTPDPKLQINARTHMLQGTSMASPVVTGLVANILAEEPNLTLPDVLNRLKTASAIPAGSTHQPPAGTPAGQKPLSQDWGYGLVDAGKLKP